MQRTRVARQTHQVYLIPGFFGFANFGDIRYFGHVEAHLQAALAARGMEAKIHAVETHPTSSIRMRTLRLVRFIERTAGDDDPITLIGHSTGGLDARLLTAPSVSLPDAGDVSQLAQRIRTVVTVCTPHDGTPAAAFFASIFGQRLLQVFSLATIYTLQFGHLPLSAVIRLGAIVTRLDRLISGPNTVLDQLYTELLGDFNAERREAIRNFLRDIRSDQSLVLQLTPDGIDLFNASVVDRPDVVYGSVIAKANPPRILAVSPYLTDPVSAAGHVLYQFLHRITARTPRRHHRSLDALSETALREVYGKVPSRRDNDGMVPTRSQVWSHVVHATSADHLDVLGHFADPRHVPPHYDWIATNTGFRRPQFDALWNDVADFVANPPRPRPVAITDDYAAVP